MEEIELERAGAIALNRIFGDSPKTAKALVDILGSAAKPFTLGSEKLVEILGPYRKETESINGEALEGALKEIERMRATGADVICILEKSYPDALRECEDAPVGLYYRSSSPPEEIFNRSPMVSVIGTRDLSSYGKEWCERIVASLAGKGNGPTIVSGLAIGVDICAQMTALTVGLPTIGVLPTGIDSVYPRIHSLAAEKIIASKGSALISDFPPQTPSLQYNFLKRNRIIAGLSAATILVESREKGGGMMTARLASEYGRDVFALPGRIDDPRSGGCNLLLRRKTAEPIVSLEGLREDLGLGRFTAEKQADLEERVMMSFPESGEELNLLLETARMVKKCRGISMEEICEKTGKAFSDISAACWALESEGILEMDLLQRCSIKSKIF